MFEMLDKARTLESKYRLLDPTLMGKDAEYTSYGPYAICSKLQDEHGKLIAESDWPALAMKLPESNSAPAGPLNQVPTSTNKAIQCYKCHQWGYKANDPKYPLFTQQNLMTHLPYLKVKRRNHLIPAQRILGNISNPRISRSHAVSMVGSGTSVQNVSAERRGSWGT